MRGRKIRTEAKRIRSSEDENKATSQLLNFSISAFILFLSLFILFLHGCSAIEAQRAPSDQSKGQVTLFLNGPDKASQNITFELSAVNIISEEGVSREITSAPLNINSVDIIGRQVVLGEASLPEGKYKKLQLVIKEAAIKSKEQPARLALPPEGVELAINIDVKRKQSTTLFINWDPDTSVANGFLFKPAVTVKGQIPELSTSLIYVTNEDSDSVSVINRQTEEVVATITVGKKPRGVTAVMGRDRLKVYVANSGSNSISVIDPTTNKVENELPIRLGKEPEGIAVTSLPSGKDFIFVTNYNSNSVSMIDPLTLQEMEKIDVGKGPIAVAVDPPVENLLGTRFLSFEEVNIIKGFREKFFNVYVVNQNSNSVSVIMMDSLTSKPKDVITVNVDWNPIALAVDYQRGKVYVANYNSDKLSVIDILQIIKGNKTTVVSTINNLGASITGVIPEPSFDRIYLLKERPGEIMIIKPFTDSAAQTVMPPVMGIIPAGSAPRSFILDSELRKIYVVNRGSNNISIIDKTTRKQERVIPAGMKPYGIAMFPK
ncbi:MAG: YncE family protein [Nitrospirae bacterium]|nr:YncE family protein [Nitrospirota bacterium]